MGYFKPEWKDIHCKAIEEFRKDPRTMRADTVEDIVSIIMFGRGSD